MENGQKAISDLFESRRIFNIPKYQRAYAWETKQLRDFISDLDNQSLGKDYFFGTILLQIGDSEGYFKIINIVDGQQRLTTLTIFMRLLLDKLDSFGDDVSILRETYVQYRNEYKLRVLEYDQQFFCKCILEDYEDTESLIETPSQRRLLEAKNFFKKDLETRNVENLREIREKIEKAKVLTYAVLNNAEATLIFETTNDRGKDLTSLEKIKSFLMYKVYLAANDPESYLTTIQNRFGEIYRDYEETIQKLTINEDFILRNHYVAFEANDGQKDYSRHLSLIKERINSLTASPATFAEATKFIDEYSCQLSKTFAIFNQVSQNLRGNLLNLIHLNRTAYLWPLLIVSYKHDNSQENYNFGRVTKLMEIISFRVYGIRKRKLKNTRISKRLHELAQNFQGDFEVLISGLKDIVGEFCSNREFEERLISPDFYEAISGNDLNYLFWQYENYLRRTEYVEDKPIGFRQYKGLSIEHIIPQETRQIHARMDEGFWSNGIHSIGNLTLDMSWENSAKSNRDFDFKYKYFYQNSRFRCQQELITFTNSDSSEWDETSITKRQAKIVNFAMRYWDYQSR
ncbi:DUF262 domain-containing protein [Planktothrix paucivesiculata]|uniref:DUF262 domain-containing protein n=1 Tax=Planktothrix paucivesiculata PCC 9631 TaxID=671071 RepID=A0A7Z9BP70_9CYAN|nr:DUF262 domain-containing protein [Planktothrix paucivesiculata]VXD19458.1 conserved hypothetical protein [Planktothrix paucivesiculata PCC 9631]